MATPVFDFRGGQSLWDMAAQYPEAIASGLLAAGEAAEQAAILAEGRLCERTTMFVVPSQEGMTVSYRSPGQALPRGVVKFKTAGELGEILPQLSPREAAMVVASLVERTRQSSFYHRPGWFIQPGIEVDGVHPR